MSNIYVYSIPYSGGYYFYRYDNIGTVQQIGRRTFDSIFYEKKRGRRHIAYRISEGVLTLNHGTNRERVLRSMKSHIRDLKFFCDNGSTDPEDHKLLKEFEEISRDWAM
jgi:hypothetical protein